MNLSITGHHLEVTPALRDYVTQKLERITRHFDRVIDVKVFLSVDKLVQKAEINIHVRGKDIFAEATDDDLYAAIDALVDKLDRQVLKYKDKQNDHGHEALKQQPQQEQM
ncbi:MAG TPA: ribosome-associated translation inhibitor RaiA [Quisquiliibacterium sp.]|nr:ribosome-associated translation inhibitor RaiA [Quisquiliibacterium sp.]